jgi:uncharacterized glyoxalase superfamily protein PhnB
MSTTPTTTTPNIFLALRYHDAKKALEWLSEAFGFEKTYGTPEQDGTIGHAEMRFGQGTIMFSSARESTEGDPGPDLLRARWSIYVYVEESALDAHYERARAAGAEITRELTATDYGAREYSARDFEGNHWSFGTYLPQPAS